MSWGEVLYLKKIIQGQKKLAPSDNIIAILPGSATTQFSSEIFIPKTSGSVRLFVELNGRETYYIYEDGTLIETIEGISQIDFPVTKGKTYQFQSGNGSYTSYFKIGAHIIDGSLFDIKENIQ